MNKTTLTNANQTQNILREIDKRSSDAYSCYDRAKLNLKDPNLFKISAEKFQELATLYDDLYSLFKNITTNKNLFIIKANMYHELYNCNASYAQFYNINQNFTNSILLYQKAENNINKAIIYISNVLNENLSKEEQKSAEHEFYVWSLESLINSAQKSFNEHHNELKNNQYYNAYDKADLTLNYLIKIQNELNDKPQHFGLKNTRRYKAQIEAIKSNLFCVSSFQSVNDYYKNSDFNNYFDIIWYLVNSYEHSKEALKIDNFWSDYKNIRNNLYQKITKLLIKCKKKWCIILQKSNNNSTIIEIMKSIDFKYYKKISNSKDFFIMKFIKNNVKTKGNVTINNDSNNITISANHSDSILSSNDKNNLNKFIEYIKSNASNELNSNELIETLSKLNAILTAKTINQTRDAFYSWNTFKSKLNASALQFLSLSSDLITIGSGLKNLLGL